MCEATLIQSHTTWVQTQRWLCYSCHCEALRAHLEMRYSTSVHKIKKIMMMTIIMSCGAQYPQGNQVRVYLSSCWSNTATHLTEARSWKRYINFHLQIHTHPKLVSEIVTVSMEKHRLQVSLSINYTSIVQKRQIITWTTGWVVEMHIRHATSWWCIHTVLLT